MARHPQLPGLVLFALALANFSANADMLAAIEKSLALRYPLAQISAPQLFTEHALLFDVRSAEEYAVSHLPGAVRISPESNAADFIARYRARLHGHMVVFYCTVGARSSRLARAVQDGLEMRDEVYVYNLRGGILRWRQAGLPLVNDVGPTAWVHPYSRLWAHLVSNPEWMSAVPRNDVPRPHH